jgi:nucleotide-binding universal stress UspA family protein
MGTRKISSTPAKLRLVAAPTRILVPLDFSSCSLQALRHALTLARICAAEILLVHVLEPLHPGSMLEGAETRRLHELALHEAAHRLGELARTNVKQHAQVRCLVRAGKPFAVIATLARKTGSDLIVVGTHGHTGFPAVLLGSTAERVARRAPCPVLLVREPEVKKRRGKLPDDSPTLP